MLQACGRTGSTGQRRGGRRLQRPQEDLGEEFADLGLEGAAELDQQRIEDGAAQRSCLCSSSAQSASIRCNKISTERRSTLLPCCSERQEFVMLRKPERSKAMKPIALASGHQCYPHKHEPHMFTVKDVVEAGHRKALVLRVYQRQRCMPAGMGCQHCG